MPIRLPYRLAHRSPALLLLLLPFAALSADRLKPKPIPSPYQLQLEHSADYRLYGSLSSSVAIAKTPIAIDKKPYAREIEAAALASDLDPVLVHALIHVESGHRKDAISNKGAVGLMQVLPATALRFGVQQPAQVKGNLRAGTRYLRVLLDRFDQRLDLALAAYNAGEGAVGRYGGIPPYAETQLYVPAVLNTYTAWRGRNGSLRQIDASKTGSSTTNQARMMR